MKQIKNISGSTGTCFFCGSQEASLIAPSSLMDLFGPLVDMYSVNEGGDLLADCIQRDWITFSIDVIAKSTELLVAITGDDAIRTARYNARVEGDASQLERWDAFREELKHKKRYFPQLVPDPLDLRNLFEMLTMRVCKQSLQLYRARNHTGRNPFGIEDMGMPPYERATSGRANPHGIPYLYLASDVATALAEIRPFKGDFISVAEYEVVDDLALVDLRNPRHTISPFAQADDSLPQLFKDLPYLDLLGDELSRPVGTGLAELEYLPSQYLCEFIKHIGFEGLVYGSSLGPGYNVALFADDRVRSTSVTDYHIDRIQLTSSQVAL